MILKKIKVKGQYTGINKRGLTVGGVPMMPNFPAKTVEVDEATYKRLVEGEKNGWFKIVEDNYDLFLASKRGLAPEIKTNEIKNENVDKPVENVDKPAENAVDNDEEEKKEADAPKKVKRTTKKKETAAETEEVK